MIIAHGGSEPAIDPQAWVAPDATVCGAVTIGTGSRVMHGARIIGEGGGRIVIGRYCIIMENAVIRATAKHACSIDDHCLIGPGAHIVGATLRSRVFVATGAAIFHGAEIGEGAEIRVHATVHLRTALPAGETVPIGWVAVGSPAQLFSPDRHNEIWKIQEPLDFPNWVYGVARDSDDAMHDITLKLSAALDGHASDTET